MSDSCPMAYREDKRPNWFSGDDVDKVKMECQRSGPGSCEPCNLVGDTRSYFACLNQSSTATNAEHKANVYGDTNGKTFMAYHAP